jgi:hypothetical protein
MAKMASLYAELNSIPEDEPVPPVFLYGETSDD